MSSLTFVESYLADHRVPPPTLALAETTVLQYASYGLNRRATAELLGITEETVKSYNSNARLKLRAKNTTHAVALAIRQGLIQ